MKASIRLKLNPFSTAERRLILVVAPILFLASCGGAGIGNRYEAEFSPWAMSLRWMHRSESDRFESLELVLKPNRMGEDLKIDGEAVHATYEHGAPDECPRFHQVEGTLRLLQHNTSEVRARVDAVMRCPGAEPVALKGEFAFEVKVPP